MQSIRFQPSTSFTPGPGAYVISSHWIKKNNRSRQNETVSICVGFIAVIDPHGQCIMSRQAIMLVMLMISANFEVLVLKYWHFLSCMLILYLPLGSLCFDVLHANNHTKSKEDAHYT